MIYKTEYFQLAELLPKEFYADEKASDNRWWLFDQKALWTLDRLRERFGKCYVNNWPFGGANQWGGWRPFDCKIGAVFSQHKFGRAFDVKFEIVRAEEVRQDIREHPLEYAYQYITCIEKDVSWLHFDTRNWTVGLMEIEP